MAHDASPLPLSAPDAAEELAAVRADMKGQSLFLKGFADDAGKAFGKELRADTEIYDKFVFVHIQAELSQG